MQVQYVTEPFEHLILRDVYSTVDLEKIFKELEFLTQKNRLISSDYALSNSNKKSNYLVNLNDVFADETFSDILSISKRILDYEITDNFKQFHNMFNFMDMINSVNTFLSYYENDDYYDFHRDQSVFSILTYFFKEPKKFVGGDLYFENTDYKIPIENNMSVIYLGCSLHSGGLVQLEQEHSLSGNGKYCLAQFLNVKPQDKIQFPISLM